MLTVTILTIQIKIQTGFMAYKVKEKKQFFFYLQNVFMQRIFSVFFTNKETVM